MGHVYLLETLGSHFLSVISFFFLPINIPVPKLEFKYEAEYGNIRYTRPERGLDRGNIEAG